MTHLKILCVEDSSFDADLIENELCRSGLSFTFRIVDAKADYLRALQDYGPDVVICDHSLPQFGTFEALKLLQESGLDIPFIMVTGTVSEELAIKILQAGATDYILKEKYIRLPIAIKNALRIKALEVQQREYVRKLEESEHEYRQLFFLNPVPMWIMSRTDYRFLDCNEATIRRYGYSREEFLKLTALDLRPVAERAKFLENVTQKEVGPRNAGIWLHMKKDGTLLWVEITSSLIDHKGKQALLILANDVTQIIRYTKGLEELVHITSHKVRQPVVQIQGIINLIDKGVVSEEELPNMLAYFKQCAGSLDDFTRELTERLYKIKSQKPEEMNGE